MEGFNAVFQPALRHRAQQIHLLSDVAPDGAARIHFVAKIAQSLTVERI
jgi:hypothetical protein